MRNRAKIIVNNREVAKRYLGDREVWSSGPLLLFEGELNLGTYKSNYYLGDIEKINYSEIKALQIEGKEIFKLREYSFQYLFNDYIGISVHEPGIGDYFGITPNYTSSKKVKIKFYGE